MKHRNSAFTLIELLVVVAIVAILAAILFPVFVQAKESAKLTADLSNARQIGLSVKLYLADSDDTMPIFYAYNTKTPDGRDAWHGLPEHKGIEVQLAPYVKSRDAFRSPFDNGGPFQETEKPGSTTYWDTYGSSYRFMACMYTVVPGESSQNNIVFGPEDARTVTESQIEFPAETRVVRLEVFPFFSRDVTPGACERYGWDCDPPHNYYRKWGDRGGSIVHADGSARVVTKAGVFDNGRVNPRGDRSGDPNPDSWSGTWYGVCD
jgi:prepilin-type N-terminal cleavage/methylation domain-containing protein